MDFADFQIHPEMSGCGIQKTYNVRAQEGLRDALPGKRIGRNHRIGAGGEQMFFRAVFTGARNDLEVRIQSASGEDNIEVGRVRRCSCD